MSCSHQVWSKFSITKQNGSVIKLRILEVEKGMDDVIDFFKKYFAKEESTLRAAVPGYLDHTYWFKNGNSPGIPESQEAIDEVAAVYSELIKAEPHHVVFCCLDYDEEIPEILGASMMVDTKHKESVENLELPIKTKQVQKLMELVGYMMANTHEMISHQKVDRYFDGKGIVVHPDYRGCGIARELLKVRRLVCKDRGVPITCAWMTAYGSQKAAVRDGWETGFEVDYEEFGRLHGVTFTNVPTTCKLMFARISN